MKKSATATALSLYFVQDHGAHDRTSPEAHEAAPDVEQDRGIVFNLHTTFKWPFYSRSNLWTKYDDAARGRKRELFFDLHKTFKWHFCSRSDLWTERDDAAPGTKSNLDQHWRPVRPSQRCPTECNVQFHVQLGASLRNDAESNERGKIPKATSWDL